MFINYFVPMDDEMNTGPHMILKDSKLEWDPHDVEMAANRPYGENDVLVNAIKSIDKK